MVCIVYCRIYIVCTVHDIEYVCIEYVLYSVCDVGCVCLLSVGCVVYDMGFVLFTVVLLLYVLYMILNMHVLSIVCVMYDVGYMDTCVLWYICCVSYGGFFSAVLPLSGWSLTGADL